MKEAALPSAYSLNGGNLQYTGHSTDLTPTAAMADNQKSANAVIAIVRNEWQQLYLNLPCETQANILGVGSLNRVRLCKI